MLFWLGVLIKLSACCISVGRAKKQQALLSPLHSETVHAMESGELRRDGHLSVKPMSPQEVNAYL